MSCAVQVQPGAACPIPGSCLGWQSVDTQQQREAHEAEREQLVEEEHKEQERQVLLGVGGILAQVEEDEAWVHMQCSMPAAVKRRFRVFGATAPVHALHPEDAAWPDRTRTA